MILADAAYDSDRVRKLAADKGVQAVIPNNPSRARKHDFDRMLYNERHLIECCFAKLKQFRRVATRYEKTARNYAAVVTLAAVVLWLRQLSTPPRAAHGPTRAGRWSTSGESEPTTAPRARTCRCDAGSGSSRVSSGQAQPSGTCRCTRHLQHLHLTPSPRLGPHAPAVPSRGIGDVAPCGWRGRLKRI